MRRVYLDARRIDAQDTVVEGADANHLQRVLRLAPGDAVVVFDGAGREFDARIDRFSDGRVWLCLTGRRAASSESPLAVTLVQGYLKEGKMDALVRQATELGVARFVPFFASRSIPRPAPDKLAARMARWERIARESLKQCRRSRVPRIDGAVEAKGVVDLAAGADLKIVFWEEEGEDPADSAAPFSQFPKSAVIVLGPEGGLDPSEVERFRRAGFATASLGPRILRAETAAVAACALVQYLFGDMGQKAEGGRQKVEEDVELRIPDRNRG